MEVETDVGAASTGRYLGAKFQSILADGAVVEIAVVMWSRRRSRWWRAMLDPSDPLDELDQEQFGQMKTPVPCFLRRAESASHIRYESASKHRSQRMQARHGQTRLYTNIYHT
eukprot:g18577.t1